MKRWSKNKAIALPTWYRGIEFRSRLEARWAVFFDTLSIRWEYEREGYQLGDLNYLPDFWLPQFEFWVEVKGLPLNRNEKTKAHELAMATGRRVYVFAGSHEMPPHDPVPAELFLPNGEWDNEYFWTECQKCEGLGVAWNGQVGKLPCHCFDTPHRSKNWYSHRLSLAYQAARSERFGT